MFYHTHLHSVYSLSDSLITPEKLVKRLKELNMDKVAITDHGNLYHVMKFREVLVKEGIQHFPGCEFYYCDDASVKDKDHRKKFHLVAIAKTEQGVKNLYKLSSLSFTEGFYYAPRIDFEMIKKYNEGLVFSSACIQGQISIHILKDELKQAREVAKKFKDLLGDRFFIELMPHALEDQIKVNLELIKIANELNIDLITTCDSHFTYRDEAQYRRFLILMNKTGWGASDEELGTLNSLYVMSEDDVKREFAINQPGIPEEIVAKAIENTNKVLSGEAPKLDTEDVKLPKVSPEGKTDEQYFIELIDKGLKERGLEGKQEYLDRVLYEFNVIKEAGFINYFLVVHEMFDWCRKEGIYTGVARGCFTKEAMVLTKNGLKYIDKVKIGDEVVTSSGKFEKVQNVFSYSINEKTVKFNYLYNGNIVNRCTLDHKILVKRNEEVSYIPAKDLRVGDLLCSPKINFEKHNKYFSDYIDLNKYNIFGYKYDEEFIYEQKCINQNDNIKWSKRGVSKISGISINCINDILNKKSTVRKTSIEKLLKFIPFKSVEEWKDYLLKNTTKTVKIKRYIKNDYEFNVFIGMLYGDGFTSHGTNAIGMAVNKTTKNVLNKSIFYNIANRIGVNVYENVSKNKNLIQLYINSKIFTNFIATEFFVSKKGKLKEFNDKLFNQSNKNLKGLLDGLYITDGSNDVKHRRINFDNISNGLIGAVKILGSILGYKPQCIYVRKQYIDKRGYNNKESYKLTLSNSKNKINNDNKFWYLPVTEIDFLEKEKINVYDLQIENNPSYTLNNIIVHNSAGGSLIAYLLFITNIDPLKFGLIFERFYNAGRKGAEGAPDIDSDFEDERREEVIKHLEDKYGKDNVSQICNISYLKVKSCIRDVSRVLNIPLDEVSKITSNVPWDEYDNLEEALNNDDKAKEFSEKYPELFEKVKYFENFPRHLGKHAAGIVIANENIGNICPMKIDKENGEMLISQFDKNDIKHTGLIKFDLLGLSTMTFLKHIVNIVKERHGKKIDLLQIPLDDKNVFKFVYENNFTDNVFQFESDGMREYLKKIKPERLDDIIALNALYRPATINSGAIDAFIKAKNGQNNTTGIKELDEIFESTNGVMVYDEQKMQIVQKLGNFDLKDVNKFRKRSDKFDDVEKEEFRQKFVKGAITHNVTEEQANKIFNSLCGYSFCRAHATAYAIISYWCAWFKYYYPIEFLKASFLMAMSADSSKYNIKTALTMASMFGFKIKGADINKSKHTFNFDDENQIVYWGFSQIKGIGESVAQVIEENQPYTDFNDFLNKTKGKKVTKRSIEPLIMLGAFDDLNCFNQIEDWWKKGKYEGDIKEFYNTNEKIKESKYLGMIFSNHIDRTNQKLVNCISKEELDKKPEESEAILAGLITSIDREKSKKGNYYGFITLTDEKFNKFEVLTTEKIVMKLQLQMNIGDLVVFKVKKLDSGKLSLVKEMMFKV